MKMEVDVFSQVGLERLIQQSSVELAEAKDEIERLQREIRAIRCENAALRANNERLIEDRARFPSRPDDIGRMIGAHIGNLKHGKTEADRHACNAIYRASRLAVENEQLRAALKPDRAVLIELLRSRMCGPHQECDEIHPCVCRDAADAVIAMLAGYP